MCCVDLPHPPCVVWTFLIVHVLCGPASLSMCCVDLPHPPCVVWTCLILHVLCAADIELGLKRDTLGAADGSSLEALLKGEPLDRRGGAAAAEVRGPEEDPVPEPVAASASTHTSSGRIRKVGPSASPQGSLQDAFSVQNIVQGPPL